MSNEAEVGPLTLVTDFDRLLTVQPGKRMDDEEGPETSFGVFGRKLVQHPLLVPGRREGKARDDRVATHHSVLKGNFFKLSEDDGEFEPAQRELS